MVERLHALWEQVKRQLRSHNRAVKALPDPFAHLDPEQQTQNWATIRQIQAIEAQVQAVEAELDMSGKKPVVFMLATGNVKMIGLQTLMVMVMSWSLRLAGQPVRYLICQRGMKLCVLGTNKDGIIAPPPCDRCQAIRQQIYPAHLTRHITLKPAEWQTTEVLLSQLNWTELCDYEWRGIRIGQSALTSLRWVRRMHHLEGDEFDLATMRAYLLSAMHMGQAYEHMLTDWQPRAVIVFNGLVFPEATAHSIAQQHGVDIMTFETGLTGTSLFVTRGLAPTFPVDVPDHFVMTPAADAELDAYMTARSAGNFSIAGRKQWSEIKSIAPDLIQSAQQYRRSVVIFTNVIWDTSQVYAATLFSDMFAWLDQTLQAARHHPDVLFIVRAHPDEKRRGKFNREQVSDWLAKQGFLALPNIVLIPPETRTSSYELLHLTDLCIVYNSTIGLEAAASGKYVLTGGTTRYRVVNACADSSTAEEYLTRLITLLTAETIQPPPEWQLNARRFYYYSLFRATLPLEAFAEPTQEPEFTLKPFTLDALRSDASPTVAALLRGFLQGQDFHRQ